MNVKSIIIIVSSFVVSVMVGFGATKLLRTLLEDTGKEVKTSMGQSASVGSSASAGSSLPAVSKNEPEVKPEEVSKVKPQEVSKVKPKEKSEVEEPAVVIPSSRQSAQIAVAKVSGPYFSHMHRTYSVTLEVNGEYKGKNLEFTLYDSAKKKLESNSTGKFVLPQTESGLYYATVKEQSAVTTSEYKEIRGCKIRKMTKERLQQICNSGNYGSMSKEEAYEIAGNVKLDFVGLAEGDIAPGSIDDICTRKSMDIIKSVVITSISYDELNRVSKVTFKVEV